MSHGPEANLGAQNASDMPLSDAASLSRHEIEAMLSQAIDLYRVRVLDNIDLSRIPDLEGRARVVARALMERGDARAFVLGRRLMAASRL